MLLDLVVGLVVVQMLLGLLQDLILSWAKKFLGESLSVDGLSLFRRRKNN